MLFVQQGRVLALLLGSPVRSGINYVATIILQAWLYEWTQSVYLRTVSGSPSIATTNYYELPRTLFGLTVDCRVSMPLPTQLEPVNE